MDTAIFSKTISEMKAPVQEEEVTEGEYGIKHNADGTLTFYVYANEAAFAPMVYWGYNKTNPALSDLGGAVMEKNGSKAGYFTYTTAEKVGNGTNVSYMFGYTPVGEAGRKDTAIMTQTVK